MSLSFHDSTRSIEETEHETTDVKPSLDALAVALTFSQTIRSFRQDAPSKAKWCDLSNSDVKRFQYYGIIEPAEMNMGQNMVWTLTDWVTRLLDLTEATFNFSTKQIKQITDNCDFLLTTDDVFPGSEAPVGNRKLGQLRRLEILEFDNDNRNNHGLTTWKRTEKVERLCNIHQQL